MMSVREILGCAMAVAFCSIAAHGADNAGQRPGYYREPAVHGDTLIFTSEGDLWTVGVHGGAAHRLTSAPGQERRATISPDGQTVAFHAEYEGPDEVYTMPVGGGIPQRQTWDGGADPVGWNPDGRLMIETLRYATLPDPSLVLIGSHGEREMLPLATGSEAVYSLDGKTLFFTRMEWQGSNTKRYKGGFIQNLWRYDGHGEAVPLTSDWVGTSHAPMVLNGRVYFLSDRDGVMNVWSMDPEGHGLKQESHQKFFDVQSASAADGRIVYASAGDLWSLDLATGREAVIPIALVSDFDQLREHWVAKPMSYITEVHLAPDGSRVVFTARGEIFTMPAKTGRVIRVAGNSEVRYRAARFLPDGMSVVALSTASGETEFWKFPANGEGAAEQWTNDAKVLRWEGIPSPDGRWRAHDDKDQQLWIFDTKTKDNKRIAESMSGRFEGLSWSPDSRWLAYVEQADNNFAQVRVLNVESGKMETLTSDRYNSTSPAWSSDGKKWLYFLSDRALNTTVPSPWGPREPDPHFNHPEKIYAIALVEGLRSPFLAADELHPDTVAREDKKPDDAGKADSSSKKEAGKEPATDESRGAEKKPEDKKLPEAKIDFAGIGERLTEVPVPPGNYENLQVTDKRLCWVNASDEIRPKMTLDCLSVDNKGDEPDTVMADVRGYEISGDRKKMLIRHQDDFFVVDSDLKSTSDAKVMAKAKVDLSHWEMSTTPRESPQRARQGRRDETGRSQQNAGREKVRPPLIPFHCLRDGREPAGLSPRTARRLSVPAWADSLQPLFLFPNPCSLFPAYESMLTNPVGTYFEVTVPLSTVTNVTPSRSPNCIPFHQFPHTAPPVMYWIP